MHFRLIALALLVAAGFCGVAPASAEVLYDSRGRPVIDEPRGGDGYRPPRREPRYDPYREPAYNPYPEQRQSRFEQGRICVTGYGQTCPLAGPTFVGKQCKCVIPGYGRIDGTAR